MRSKPAGVFAAAVGTAAVALSAAVLLAGETSPLEPRPAVLTLPWIGLLIYGSMVLVGAVLAGGDAGGHESQSERSRFVLWVVLGALATTGFVLRIAHLWNYAYCNDEALFVSSSSHASLSVSIRDCLNHFHPPTNFIMLHYLLKVSWSPLWVRLPAVVGGTLAIPLTFVFVRTLFGSRAGVVAAFLVAFSPHLILLSQVCRNYAPSFPFVLISLIYLGRALRDGRFNPVHGFALFELLSVLWHYAYLPLFLGANLVLFTWLLRSKAGFPVIARAVVIQLPIGLVYLIAQFFHRPLTMSGLQQSIVAYMDDEFNFDPRHPFKQLVALFHYLLAASDDPARYMLVLVFIGLAAYGGIELWRRGRGWNLALCLSFLPFALVFAFVLQTFPFGGTRHSVYAFPLLFALVAGGAARVAEGGGARGADQVSPTPDSRARASRRFSPGGAFVALLLGGYLFVSLQSYAEVTPYYLRSSPAYSETTPYYRPTFYKIPELPTRNQDIDGLTAALLRYSRPGDIVICSMPVLMILNAALGTPPREIPFQLETEHEFQWEGRTFLYVPGAGLGLTPAPMVITLAAEAQNRDWGASHQVWIALVGWDTWAYTLYEWSEVIYPEILVPSDAWGASRGTLFAVQVGPVMSRMHAILDWISHPVSPEGRTDPAPLGAPGRS